MPSRTPLAPITLQEASAAKLKNIVELGFDFSAMTRVFAAGSYDAIVRRLEEFIAVLETVKSQDDYDRLHSEFCLWFTGRIYTASKQFKSGRSNPSCPSLKSLELPPKPQTTNGVICPPASAVSPVCSRWMRIGKSID